jgi:hypothetical protein
MLEEFQHIRPSQLPAQHGQTGSVGSMYLKDVLGDIQTNYGNFHGGRLLSAPGFDSQEHGTLMPLRGRPPHHGNFGRAA